MFIQAETTRLNLQFSEAVSLAIVLMTRSAVHTSLPTLSFILSSPSPSLLPSHHPPSLSVFPLPLSSSSALIAPPLQLFS